MGFLLCSSLKTFLFISRLRNMEFSAGLTRAVTFDERFQRDQDQDFTPIFKAMSFDSRHTRRPFTMMTKANSFAEPVKLQPVEPGDTDKVVIVVDTFSTGAYLAYLLYKQGYKIICVLSGDLGGLLELIPKGLQFSYMATFQLDTTREEAGAFSSLMEQINALGVTVSAVFAGAETGVELADKLSEHLPDCPTNGTSLSEARRNKYVMGETVRNAGNRAVKQLRSSSWDEVCQYISEWNPQPFRVVVKPVDSAGSDDVTLCKSMEEVKVAFHYIISKTNAIGIANTAILVQEYLEGQGR